jgi:hypothetical protein
MIHALFAVAALATGAPPDPYQIFARARAYWDAQRYPRFIDYDTVVDVHSAKGERVERYVSAYDSSSGTTWIDPVSDYELAHPATGRGVNIGFGNGDSKQHLPAPDIDFIGVPMLAPNYSFTIGRFVATASEESLSDADIVNQVRDAFHDPNPRPSVAPTSTTLPEIGSVVAYKHDYNIGYAGEETVDGTEAYHLTLRPFRVDGRYRLRDVWVEKGSYATVRARTALNFVDGPGTQVPWTIDFADVGGARYIAQEAADGTYAYARVKYDRVDIRFENIRPRMGILPYDPIPVSAFLVLTEPAP